MTRSGGWRKPPRTGESLVGDAAQRLVGKLDTSGALERARAVAVWREAAGEEVAAHAMGFSMRDHELVVGVDSPVWANELSALSEQYRTEVNRLAGRELVRSVRFTVSKRVTEEKVWDAELARSQAEGRREHVEPVAATAQEEAQIAAMAAPIHDDALRQAAVRAALRALEWKKGRKVSKTPQAGAERPQKGDSGSEH